MELLFALIYLALAIVSACRKRWLWVRLCLVSTFLSFIPLVLERHTIIVDKGLELFLFVALLLHLIGGVFGLYKRYNWDFLTHLISGMGAAAAFLVTIATIDRYTETINLPSWATASVIVMFTMASGVLWEIGEFVSDTLFGTTEQQGLYDIISDLANDLAGSVITAVFAWLYIREPDRLVSLDYNAIRRLYPQLGYMRYLVLVGIAVFLIYFLIRKEWSLMALSVILLTISAFSSVIKIPLLIEMVLFASLLILFVEGLFSIDAGLYQIIFAVGGLAAARIIYLPFVTNPWFFTALTPVSSLFLSSIFEMLRYVSDRRVSDREVMTNFIHTFVASLLATFSGFIYIIT
jgi:hypothetical protein